MMQVGARRSDSAPWAAAAPSASVRNDSAPWAAARLRRQRCEADSAPWAARGLERQLLQKRLQRPWATRGFGLGGEGDSRRGCPISARRGKGSSAGVGSREFRALL
ncbi:hypothetical protein CYMTET_51517 [Cymbomonas tetramitiformis]|uniref:Uncharacterized protein n=1 Tax=Cymbomonas tetramitiformis TaxID=36881 RepID=A0AAE0BMC7_9CHLO|nr:hypothetical protein CYMTET_51517 [Cymbomonas tetramitiformis]